MFIFYVRLDDVVLGHGNKFALTLPSEGLYGTSCVFI
jgi:hypothetical protein